MIRWTKPDNLVRRRKDGTLWTADGSTPFPITGWNFARCIPLPLGWRVISSERFITYDQDSFDVLWCTRDGGEDTPEGRHARGLSVNGEAGR